MKTQNEKMFNSTIKAIKTLSENLADDIHDAGLFALTQVNEHGNDGFCVRLVEAMGKKHDAQRVVNWLVRFGKVGVKDGHIIYKNRKDITPETLPAWIEKAEATPYWELTPQKKLIERVDYLASLAAIIHKHKAMEKKAAEGAQVEELNVGVIKEVEALIARLTAKPAQVVEGNQVVTM